MSIGILSLLTGACFFTVLHLVNKLERRVALEDANAELDRMP